MTGLFASDIDHDVNIRHLGLLSARDRSKETDMLNARSLQLWCPFSKNMEYLSALHIIKYRISVVTFFEADNRAAH